MSGGEVGENAVPSSSNRLPHFSLFWLVPGARALALSLYLIEKVLIYLLLASFARSHSFLGLFLTFFLFSLNRAVFSRPHARAHARSLLPTDFLFVYLFYLCSGGAGGSFPRSPVVQIVDCSTTPLSLFPSHNSSLSLDWCSFYHHHWHHKREERLCPATTPLLTLSSLTKCGAAEGEKTTSNQPTNRHGTMGICSSKATDQPDASKDDGVSGPGDVKGE